LLNLRYDFNNLMAERVGEHGVMDAELKALDPKLSAAAKAVEKADFGFRKLPYDSKLADEIAVLAGEIQKRCDNFVVIGIGGSALGNLALHSALNHPEHNLLNRPPRRGPRLFVPDNIDPDRIAALLEAIDLENTVFNVISKSGGTAETMSEFLIFREALIRNSVPSGTFSTSSSPRIRRRAICARSRSISATPRCRFRRTSVVGSRCSAPWVCSVPPLPAAIFTSSCAERGKWMRVARSR